MTELEQRLTNELSKLAEQYEQDQKRLAGQVEHLEEQVRELVAQQDADLEGYIGWSKTLGEQVTHLGEQVQKLADQPRVRAEGVYRVDRAHGRAAGNLERTCREIDQGIQRTSAAFGRGLKLMRRELDRSLPERGRSRWRGRSRGWDFSR